MSSLISRQVWQAPRSAHVRLMVISPLLAQACLSSRSERESTRTVYEALQQAALPACAPATTSDSGWQTVRLPAAQATMRLPAAAQPVTGARYGSWLLDDGTVGYAINERAETRIFDVLNDSTAASRGWCVERGAGRPFVVQISRGHSAAGVGLHMQALGPLDDGRELVVVGFSEADSPAALMSIARSVSF
jgi:hypothetical protein